MSKTNSFQPRGRYFEQFTEGEMVVTAGRTITETDVVNFAGMSGDYNAIHTNAAYASAGIFQQRVAHGLLVMSIASGLAVQTGIIEETVLAFREVSNWKFSKPVFLGDTIRATLRITDLKPMKRLGGGAVTMKVAILNQNDDVVQRGDWVMLMMSQPPSDG